MAHSCMSTPELQARYPGDPLGQAAVAGVKKGWWQLILVLDI